MKASDYLDLADELVKRDHGAALRTAVSRAYYAVFNCIAGFYEDEGIHFDRVDNRHVKFQHILTNCGLTELQELAVRVASLHAERKRADYDMSDVRVEKKTVCEAAVLSAHDCMKDFARHKDRSVAGAKKYCTETLKLPVATRPKSGQQKSQSPHKQ